MKQPQKLLLYGIGGILGIWLGVKYFLPITLPFLFGLGLAKLAQPLVRRVRQCLRAPGWLASLLGILLVFAVLAAVVWLLVQALISLLEGLGRQLPALCASLAAPLASLQTRLITLAQKLPDGLAVAAKEWLSRLFAGGSVIADTASDTLLSLAGRILTFLPELLLFTLTALLSSYFFSVDAGRLRKGLARHLPEQWLSRGKQLATQLKTALGGYVKAQLRLSGVVFLLLVAGLLLLRRDKPIGLAALITLVDALPVFGVGTVLLPWGVLAFLRGNSALGTGMLVLYAVCAVVRAFLEPRFVGKQIGLPPLATLLALYAGFRLFGIVGMILLPIAVILLKQLYELVESA